MRSSWITVPLAMAIGLLFSATVEAKTGVCAAHSQLCHWDNGSQYSKCQSGKCSRDGAGCHEKTWWARDTGNGEVQARDRPQKYTAVICT